MHDTSSPVVNISSVSISPSQTLDDPAAASCSTWLSGTTPTIRLPRSYRIVRPSRRRLYHDTAAQCTASSADVSSLQKITGSTDQNVAELLTRYRSWSQGQRNFGPHDEDFAGKVALEHVALLGEGAGIISNQQLNAGMIDTHHTSCSSTPSATQQEITCALLDPLTPTNSIEESAMKLSQFKQESAESISN